MKVLIDDVFKSISEEGFGEEIWFETYNELMDFAKSILSEKQYKKFIGIDTNRVFKLSATGERVFMQEVEKRTQSRRYPKL